MVDLRIVGWQIAKILLPQLIPWTVSIGSLQFLVFLPHIILIEAHQEILNDGTRDQVMLTSAEIIVNRLVKLNMVVSLICRRVGPSQGLIFIPTVIKTVLKDRLSHRFSIGFHPPWL